MTCLGVLDSGERGNDNATSLKEGGGIELLTTVLPLRDARSIPFVCVPLRYAGSNSIFSIYLPSNNHDTNNSEYN